MDPSCHILPESLSLLASSLIDVWVSMAHSVSKASSVVSVSLFFLTCYLFLTVNFSSGMCLPVLFLKFCQVSYPHLYVKHVVTTSATLSGIIFRYCLVSGCAVYSSKSSFMIMLHHIISLLDQNHEVT